jgi:hypothetical protein
MRKNLAIILICGSFALTAAAKEKTVPWDSLPKRLDITADERRMLFDSTNARLFASYVPQLLAKTMGACKGYAPETNGIVFNVHTCGAKLDKDGHQVAGKEDIFPGPDDYIIIHVIAWKTLAAGSTVQEIDKQNWYVFNSRTGWDDADFATNNRIFGKKSVYMLYIHLNRNNQALYNVRYELKITSKIPAYLDHLVQLGQLAGIGTQGGLPLAGVQISDVWNAYQFQVDYVPSDLTLTPTIEPQSQNEKASVLAAKTFDNEGKYHIDFSVGVPITKISEVSYVSSSNTLVPAKVDKQNLFALFNYYPKAFDIKTSGWSRYPHLVAGVAMDSKPLQKSLIGIGYGPVIAHFYAGLLLHTYRLPAGTSCGTTPSVSQSNSAAISNRTCPEFSFGLNVAVGAIADTLKNKTKAKSN